MKWETYRISSDGEAVQEQSISLKDLHQKEDAAYVLVFYSFKMIYIYIGRSAPPRLKFGASQFAKDLQKQLGPIFRLKTIDQFDESQEFLRYLQELSEHHDKKAQAALNRRKERKKSRKSATPRLKAKVKPVTAASTLTEGATNLGGLESRTINPPNVTLPKVSSEKSLSDVTVASSPTRAAKPIVKQTPMTTAQKAVNVFTDNATSAMFHHEGLGASTAIKLIDSSLLPNPNAGTYVRRLSWSAKKSTKVKDYQVKFYVIPREESSDMTLKVTKRKPQFVLKIDSANLIGSLQVDMYIPPAHDLYVAFRMELSMTINFESV